MPSIVGVVRTCVAAAAARHAASELNSAARGANAAHAPAPHAASRSPRHGSNVCGDATSEGVGFRV